MYVSVGLLLNTLVLITAGRKSMMVTVRYVMCRVGTGYNKLIKDNSPPLVLFVLRYKDSFIKFKSDFFFFKSQNICFCGIHKY